MKEGILIYLLISTLLVAQAVAAVIDVCPAGCAHASVQAAIDAAAPHDMVLVHGGVYLEHLNIGKPLILKGDGGRAVIRSYSGDIDLFANVSGVEVEGLAFDGKGFGILAIMGDSIRIRNCTFLNQSRGVVLRRVVNALVEDCSFTGIQRTGILLEQSPSATIRSAWFEECEEGVDASRSADLRIEESTFRVCSTGIRLADSPRATIVGNRWISCERGILLTNSIESQIRGNLANRTAQPILILNSPAALIEAEKTSLPVDIARSGESRLMLGQWTVGCGDCTIESVMIDAPDGWRMVGDALGITVPEYAGEILVSAEVQESEMEGLDPDTIGIHAKENGSFVLLPQELRRGANLTYAGSLGVPNRRYIVALLGRPTGEFPLLPVAIVVVVALAAGILLLRRRR